MLEVHIYNTYIYLHIHCFAICGTILPMTFHDISVKQIVQMGPYFSINGFVKDILKCICTSTGEDPLPFSHHF